MTHNACFVLYSIFLGSSIFPDFTSTTTCQVYPSEYAYHDDTVTRAESANANCRNYPPTNDDMGHVFAHCDGEKLKLSDSDRGLNMEYTATSYYEWTAGSDGQLLLIFPTRVSLTTITLYYYSDSVRGRPRLRFYAVPDDFDVWNAPTSGTSYRGIDPVPPGGEPAGRRSISISLTFNTMKVLMYKYSESFAFAISEMEFSTISCKTSTTDPPSATTVFSSLSALTDNLTAEKHTSYFAATNSSPMSLSTITSSATGSMISTNTNIVAIGVSIAMLLILSTILIITATVLIWSYKRRSSKQVNNSSPYSTLNRRAGQPQSLQQDSPELHDHIHLSLSTGQTEYIPGSETTNINNQSQTSHPTYSTAGGDVAEHSSALNAGNQATTVQLAPQNAHESTSEQPTYAAIDKSKKKKFKLKEDAKCKAAEKGPPVTPYAGYEVLSTFTEEMKENTTKQEINSPHTIEELYTAVQKNPKPRSKDETLPPYYTTAEEKQKAGGKPPQILKLTTEDLYTAVMKKPKDGSADDTEAAPPIPPHTVEELYTAIMKKPKGNDEDEKNLKRH